MTESLHELAVWIEGELVGVLGIDDGDWRFTYQRSWLEADGAYALSPQLPLRDERFVDDGQRRSVRWFFDNLLPEGGIRGALARHARLVEQDSFALLRTFGRDSAGALTLLPIGEPFAAERGYAPLGAGALRELLSRMPRVPLLAAGGRARMSLAGAQHKLAVHRDGSGWLLPQGSAASSLILKPDNERSDLFPRCPANEHFCMTLARHLGLPTPRCWLERLPEPLYVVERFDRRVGDDGDVTRLHQIDLCQLLDLWPEAKYEVDDGPGLVEAYRALDRTRQPAVSRRQWLRWMLFNFAIGNSDAHAKNIGFLVDQRGVHLAPCYDLLSVAVYGADYDYMAMTIADEVRYGWIGAPQWDAFATTVGLPPAFLRKLRHELAEAIVPAALALVEDEVYTDDERALLRDVVALIERHAGYLVKER